MIIDPVTGHSTDRKRLVSLLVQWSSEAPIIMALLKAGRADQQGIAVLAHTIKLTMDEQPGAFDDRAVACAVVGFLVDTSVRAVVARYLSLAYSMTYDKAKDELYDLRVELTKSYRLKPSDTPAFVALGALVDEPAWVQSYRECRTDIEGTSIEWLRSRTDAVKATLRDFPPLCLVASRDDALCQFPAPGELAVVATAYEKGDEVRIGLSGSPGEGVIAEAKPEWLRVVAHCGKITPERVAEVLEQ